MVGVTLASGSSGATVAVASWPETPAWRKAAARLKVMTRPPEPCSSRRRVRSIASAFALALHRGFPLTRPGAGGALHGAQDPDVGAAAAEVAGECLADVGVVRLCVLRQEGGGRHHHARDAVAALGRLLLDERLLDGVECLCRAQALPEW